MTKFLNDAELMARCAPFALILASAFWGFGNIAQKTVLDHMSPMTATCLRCAIAAIAIFPLAFLGRKALTQAMLVSSFRVAVIFALALFVQQSSYLSTTVTNASFLVNADAILTPALAWMMLGERTGRIGIGAAVMAIFGVTLMSNGLTNIAAVNWGDIGCLVSALLFAIWVVELGRHCRTHGAPFVCASLQFTMAAAITASPAIYLESAPVADIAAALPELLVLGLLSTAVGFTLHTVAQRYMAASTASLLVSGESVFGALGAVALLGERPEPHTLAGAALILTSIVAVTVMPLIIAPRSRNSFEGAANAKVH